MFVNWRYIPPSLLTCTSVLIGLFGIFEAIDARFESSAWLIFLCALIDKLDGTAARLLKSTSRFGVELDSLADLLTFGIAPAILVYSILVGPHAGAILEGMPRFRYLVYAACSLYVICSALRLAKFNVVTDEYGTEHFFGYPTTISGAFICTYYLSVIKYQLPTSFIHALPFILFFYAVMMISRVPLRKLGPHKSLVFNIFLFSNLGLVYIFGIIRRYPEYLLTVGCLYLFVGSTWSMIAGVRPPGPRSNEVRQTGS